MARKLLSALLVRSKSVLLVAVTLSACNGTLLGTALQGTTPAGPGPGNAPSGPSIPLSPKECENRPFTAVSTPAMRLLEKEDLLRIIETAGVASPSLGELYTTRPKTVRLASPASTWQADDATALTDNLETIASKLTAKLVADEPACAKASTLAAVPTDCLEKSVNRISRTLFRRPPTAEIATVYRKAIAAEATTTGNALQALAYGFELALQSPSFLYRAELGQAQPGQQDTVKLDPWEIADALALGVGGVPADAELQALAESGKIGEPEVIKQQVRRLIATAAGKERLWLFYDRWLQLSPVSSIQKDATKFPNFSAASATAAREATRSFVLDSVFGVQAGGFRQLLRGRNGEGGVHTMAAFLMSQSGPLESRPLHLADVVLKTVACFSVPPPPVGATMTPFTPDPARSPRQNFETRTGSGSCAGCHALMNGTGFSFDGYDALGQPRTAYEGFPVDTAGTLGLDSGKTLTFANAAELMSGLSESSDARQCHAQWLYRQVHGTDEKPEQACELLPIAAALEASTANPIDAIVELYASPGFTTRKVATP
jgi:Protein of unknown function (DUF1592)/Protein of unknown function (DUF1588)/Protein of unknown function (DUF1595)